MCGLATALFYAGYAKGMIDYAADPEGIRKQMLTQTLKSSGAVDGEGNIKLCCPNSPEVQMVRRVWPRVLESARQVLRERLKVLKTKKGDNSDEIETLEQAKAQLDSWLETGFLVLDVNSPNAFVNAMVPRLIFVHRGLFHHDRLVPPTAQAKRKGASVVVTEDLGESWCEGKVLSIDKKEGWKVLLQTDWGPVERWYKEADVRQKEVSKVITKDEQLAMLLGHEISHVIHGHCEEAAEKLAIALGAQAVILSVLDPTGGLSFALELALPSLATYAWKLPHSRQNETEADMTGLEICARAGYNPKVATTFFRNLADIEEGEGGGRLARWSSTHPTTPERIEQLRIAESDAMTHFKAARKS